MTEPQTKPTQETRLIFQGSIPIDDVANAEKWYEMLKEMVKSQSPRATLNGQIMKLLEPCCGEIGIKNFAGRVYQTGTEHDHRL